MLPLFYSRQRILLVLVSLVILAGACDKRNKPAEMRVTNPEPDPSIHSVNYFINLDRSCPDYPVPSDSSSAFVVDINDDGAADFRISTEHHWRPGQVCGAQCACFDYLVMITRLHENADISAQQKSGADYIAVSYESGVEINKKSSWSGSALLPPQNFVNSYLGLRIDSHYGWMKLSGSIKENGITVHSYGISGVKDRPILSGEGQ